MCMHGLHARLSRGTLPHLTSSSNHQNETLPFSQLIFLHILAFAVGIAIAFTLLLIFIFFIYIYIYIDIDI